MRVALQLKSEDLILEFSYNRFYFCVFAVIFCRGNEYFLPLLRPCAGDRDCICLAGPQGRMFLTETEWLLQDSPLE